MNEILSENDIVKRFGRTFFFMQYRKIIRMTGGELFEKGQHPLLTSLVIILWIVNVALYSINLEGSTLIIQFNSWISLSGSIQGIIPIVGAWYFIISMALLIISTIWQYRYLVQYFTIILLLQTICSLILKYDTYLSTYERNFALAMLSIVCCFIEALIILEYLWLYVLVPAIVKWRWRSLYTDVRFNSSTNESKQEEKAELEFEPSAVSNKFIIYKSLISFPYLTITKMILFLILIIPLIIPVAIYIGFGILTQTIAYLFGFEFFHFVSFTVLLQLQPGYWKFHHNGVVFIYSRKKKYLFSFLFKPKELFFQYNGEVSGESGEPSGYGEWKDSDTEGEVLRGLW
jgi:hypothetical protein